MTRRMKGQNLAAGINGPRRNLPEDVLDEKEWLDPQEGEIPSAGEHLLNRVLP